MIIVRASEFRKTLMCLLFKFGREVLILDPKIRSTKWNIIVQPSALATEPNDQAETDASD